MPGGGISADGRTWLPSCAHFFVAVCPLSILFRANFRDALARARLLTDVDPAVWRQDWVVHSQAVGDGRASLKYLAPYVFRVAISDRRILSCNDDSVTFSYRKSGSNYWRRMTLDPTEFLQRSLQHVLPTGFQKVRHYGFLSPNSRVSLDLVHWLIALFQNVVIVLRGQPPQEAPARPRIRCGYCGGAMTILIRFDPADSTCFDTSQPMLVIHHASGFLQTTSHSQSTLRVRAGLVQIGYLWSPRRRVLLPSCTRQPLPVRSDTLVCRLNPLPTSQRQIEGLANLKHCPTMRTGLTSWAS